MIVHNSQKSGAENVELLPRDVRSANAVLLSSVIRPSVHPSVTLMYSGHRLD